RMPMILLPEQEYLWIDPNVPSKDILDNIQPVPSEYLQWYRVSDRVNKVTENDPGLVVPV
ncbi:SOS response-associated peptidase, partial [Desulfobacter hydrogenophilus]|uniref:SOS response-associated peptidase family protein n=1 Tax=Desulfobacter hydrogenophilus TaxID=2291 RepID=UPI0013D1C63C